jgi:hypothetical protein
MLQRDGRCAVISTPYSCVNWWDVKLITSNHEKTCDLLQGDTEIIIFRDVLTRKSLGSTDLGAFKVP